MILKLSILMRIYILSLIVLVSCNVDHAKNDSNSSTDTTSTSIPPDTTKFADINTDSTIANTETATIQKLKVLVVQCYNGYEFAMGGYNFNPVIEEELKKFGGVEVIPFSSKKLMGVQYQGVYDKKYSKPILEKIESDYLIMTRFLGPHPDSPNSDSAAWGYETKILNVKSMDQKISIRADGFTAYIDIEKHIRKNIQKLVNDIENLK